MSGLLWRYESKTKVVKQGTHSLSGEYLYQVWKGSFQWKESYCMVHCPIFFHKVINRLQIREHMALKIRVKVKSCYTRHTFSWWWISVPSMKRILPMKTWKRIHFSDMWSHEQMTLKTWVIHDIPPLSGEYLYQVCKVQTYQQRNIRIA